MDLDSMERGKTREWNYTIKLGFLWWAITSLADPNSNLYLRIIENISNKIWLIPTNIKKNLRILVWQILVSQKSRSIWSTNASQQTGFCTGADLISTWKHMSVWSWELSPKLLPKKLWISEVNCWIRSINASQQKVWVQKTIDDPKDPAIYWSAVYSTSKPIIPITEIVFIQQHDRARYLWSIIV